MTYKLTPFERFIAKPAHDFAKWLGKVLGNLTKPR